MSSFASFSAVNYNFILVSSKSVLIILPENDCILCGGNPIAVYSLTWKTHNESIRSFEVAILTGDLREGSDTLQQPSNKTTERKRQ